MATVIAPVRTGGVDWKSSVAGLWLQQPSPDF